MPSSQQDLKVLVRALPDLRPSEGVLLRQINDLADSGEITEEEAQELQDSIEELFAVPPVNTDPTGGDLWKNFGVSFEIPGGLVDILQSTIEKLDTVAQALAFIIKLVELTVSISGSFAKLVDSVLNNVQNGINKVFEDLSNSGIYATVIIPPALNRNLAQIPRFARLSSGGFPGFVNRLQFSLNDQNDKRRPVFSEDAKVGGAVLLIDAKTIDALYKTLNNIIVNLGLADLAPITVSPLPPNNVNVTTGRFANPNNNGTVQNAVLLQWDRPPVPVTNFRISRSQKSGGVLQLKPKVGKTIKEKISILWKKRYGEEPTEVVPTYNDPTFNNGSPVTVSSKLNGGGEYLDFDIIPNEDGSKPPNYYYVIESGYSPFFGEPSTEAAASLFDCVPIGSEPTPHSDGSREFLYPGFGGVSSWSSIAVKNIAPFLPALQNMINTLIDSMKGASKDASDTVGEIAKNIKARIEAYLRMVNLIQELIEIIIGASANLMGLNLPAESGGVSNFVKRIESAELPPDVFLSGSDGYTAGVVFVYGAGSTDAFGGDLSSGAADAYVESVKRAINLIMSVFTEE